MHVIEHLELRRLLSVALKSNGTLQINGTSGEDVVRIGFDDTFVNLIAVTLNAKQKLFQPRDVLRINVETLTGHDRINVVRSPRALGSIKLNVDTGKGNDRVTIDDIGNVKTAVLLGDGNDTLTFLRGDGFGGAGSDFIVGGVAAKVYGGPGSDRLRGAWVRGEGGDDSIEGTDGSVTLYGGRGNDNLKIQRGFAFGEDGNDVIVGSFATKIYGGNGNDRLQAAWVRGENGNDSIQGTDGSDTLYGGSGNDTLFGGDGYDALNGGSGEDSLYGGRGSDTLVGGDGTDHLHGESGDDRYPGDDEEEEITDLSQGIDDAGLTIIASGGPTLSNASFSNVGAGNIGTPTNQLGKVPASNANAYLGNAALLVGVNQLSETTKFLKDPPQLISSQINKIKPGIVAVRSDWNVTKVGTQGDILWLKVSRTSDSGKQMPIKVMLDEFPNRYDSRNTSGYSLESRLSLQTSFMAIHKRSLLALGGLTGTSTPIAATFDNIRELPLAKDARLRFANDWNNVFTVKDKAPLEPGVNPHGRRGIIVDEGIIWFDDVDQPYFQEIEL